MYILEYEGRRDKHKQINITSYLSKTYFYTENEMRNSSLYLELKEKPIILLPIINIITNGWP